MVGLQVEGRLGVVLGCSKGVCGWSWAAPWASVDGPRPLLGPLWVVWAALKASVGGPGRSWGVLGAYVGGLGPLLEPMRRVLGSKNANNMAALKCV